MTSDRQSTCSHESTFPWRRRWTPYAVTPSWNIHLSKCPSTPSKGPPSFPKFGIWERGGRMCHGDPSWIESSLSWNLVLFLDGQIYLSLPLFAGKRQNVCWSCYPLILQHLNFCNQGQGDVYEGRRTMGSSQISTFQVIMSAMLSDLSYINITFT